MPAVYVRYSKFLDLDFMLGTNARQARGSVKTRFYWLIYAVNLKVVIGLMAVLGWSKNCENKAFKSVITGLDG